MREGASQKPSRHTHTHLSDLWSPVGCSCPLPWVAGNHGIPHVQPEKSLWILSPLYKEESEPREVM